MPAADSSSPSPVGAWKQVGVAMGLWAGLLVAICMAVEDHDWGLVELLVVPMAPATVWLVLTSVGGGFATLRWARDMHRRQRVGATRDTLGLAGIMLLVGALVAAVVLHALLGPYLV